MKITKEWLQKNNACSEAITQFEQQKETNDIKLLQKLVKGKKYDWANWMIVRVMTHKQYVAYAVFAAEEVLHIYEKHDKNDNRPRLAIAAAKECIKNENKINTAAAGAAWAAGAAGAAGAAARATWATGAAWAAWATAGAAEAAAGAAGAAGAAAWAAWAAGAAEAAIQEKILKYGLKLLAG